jgi:hypothetical protein
MVMADMVMGTVMAISMVTIVDMDTAIMAAISVTAGTGTKAVGGTTALARAGSGRMTPMNTCGCALKLRRDVAKSPRHHMPGTCGSQRPALRISVEIPFPTRCREICDGVSCLTLDFPKLRNGGARRRRDDPLLQQKETDHVCQDHEGSHRRARSGRRLDYVRHRRVCGAQERSDVAVVRTELEAL